MASINFTLEYLGHSAFYVKYNDKGILIDPFFTGNPQFPYSSTDEFLSSHNVDLVVITHAHEDHIGDAPEILKKTNAQFFAIHEIFVELSKQGLQGIGANIGGPADLSSIIPGLKIAMTPATHSSYDKGAPTGVILFFDDVAAIYHAGDTGLFAEMEFIGQLYAPKVALLPIGGHYTMDIKQAVLATKMIKPEVVVPMHYNTFPPIRANPEEFKEEVERLGLAKVEIMKPGEKREFSF